MPRLDVEFVGEVDDGRSGLAARLADAAGAVFDSPPLETWVRLRFLSEDDYAENAGGPEAGVRPVFVTVLLGSPPDEDTLAVQAEALCQAVSSASQRPAENVHILFEPAARGRIAFGGKLLRG